MGFAEVPRVQGRFLGIFALVGRALVRLHNAGESIIISLFTRLLYSHEPVIDFPYVALSRTWIYPRDAFKFILTQLTPEIAGDFTVGYVTVINIRTERCLEISGAVIEEGLATCGVPLTLPVYLAVAMRRAGGSRSVSFGTARYDFIGGVDDNGKVYQKVDLPLVFAIFSAGGRDL